MQLRRVQHSHFRASHDAFRARALPFVPATALSGLALLLTPGRSARLLNVFYHAGAPGSRNMQLRRVQHSHFRAGRFL